MITVEQALDIIRQNIPPAQFEKVALIDSLGRVLAEEVFSDVDMPPFDKSAMDGYAVRSEDIKLPPVELEVLEIVPAGSMPTKEVKPGKAIKIMTGAPVPRGAGRERAGRVQRRDGDDRPPARGFPGRPAFLGVAGNRGEQHRQARQCRKNGLNTLSRLQG